MVLCGNSADLFGIVLARVREQREIVVAFLGKKIEAWVVLWAFAPFAPKGAFSRQGIVIVELALDVGRFSEGKLLPAGMKPLKIGGFGHGLWVVTCCPAIIKFDEDRTLID